MLAPDDVKLIVVHCSATKPSQDIGADEIRRWHVEDNEWSDIGYHAVIRRSGALEWGRPMGEEGAHAYGHNSYSWGLCLIGGIAESDGAPENNFLPEQFASLERVLSAWRVLAGAPAICGHRDLDSGKACPSFDVRQWITEQGLLLPRTV